jgi:hypothetical protein
MKILYLGIFFLVAIEESRKIISMIRIYRFVSINDSSYDSIREMRERAR